MKFKMNISYSKVESYCNELHYTAQKMKEIVENIENIRKKVNNSDIWSGEASSFYSDKLKKLSLNFEEIFLELENSVLFIAKCIDNYKSIDDIIAKQICDNLHITVPNLSTSNMFK